MSNENSKPSLADQFQDTKIWATKNLEITEIHDGILVEEVLDENGVSPMKKLSRTELPQILAGETEPSDLYEPLDPAP